MQSKLESSIHNESNWADQQRDLLEVRGQVADLQERLRQASDQNDTHQSDTGYLKLELAKQCKQVPDEVSFIFLPQLNCDSLKHNFINSHHCYILLLKHYTNHCMSGTPLISQANRTSY